jgi:hypothetical protein|tara:strand:- start:128 stop:1510 length:1383 start_codon:yes stop_codon:yes gene_type:complete
VRLRKEEIHGRVNADLEFDFGNESLTSFAGLELLIRYFRKIGLNDLIRLHVVRDLPGGDFGTVAMCRLVLGLVIVGARRVGHVGFLEGDPLFARFCGLKSLPSDRTVSRWLKSFRSHTVGALRRLNGEIVARMITLHLNVRTLTIDVDGTVVSTGKTVQWAFRGYNPHHRKVLSYFPITACLSETGHLLRVHNRPGNVNDGSASTPFLRALFKQMRDTLGRGYKLRFRMDADFFKSDILDLMDQKKAEYAIKVPFWPWVDLQQRILECTHWEPIEEDTDGFTTNVFLEPWDREVRVVIFRKRVSYDTRKNYQLDLFDPTEGTWEYSAVTTNLSFDVRRIWRFICGRGVHEKTIGELKSSLAFDTIPTNHYSANSAWQQLVALAHNLLTNFQIQTGAAQRPRSEKRTGRWVIQRANTLRFELFNRAARIVNTLGKPVLRLQDNQRIENRLLRIAESLKKAA